MFTTFTFCGGVLALLFFGNDTTMGDKFLLVFWGEVFRTKESINPLIL